MADNWINLKIYGDASFKKRTNVGPALRGALLDEMSFQMRRLSDYIRANKLSGQVLNRRSGDLSRSITGQATQEGDHVRGKVGSYGVPYAPVHEFGGSFNIPEHTRTISQAFGRPIMPQTISIRAHVATFPTRSYVRTSSYENERAISAALQNAATKVLRGDS